MPSQFLKFFRTSHLTLAIFLLPCLLSCHSEPEAAYPAADFRGPAASDGTRAYAIDWPCAPRMYGSSSDDQPSEQNEFCQWRTVSTSASGKVCQFTTSFDNRREFYLNSDGLAPTNSLAQALTVQASCLALADQRHAAGQTIGHLCSGLPDGLCNDFRAADAEICDKTRFWEGQHLLHGASVTSVSQPASGSQWSTLPYIRLGLLTGLPHNCHDTSDDQTEVSCEADANTTCFSIAGGLRAGVSLSIKR